LLALADIWVKVTAYAAPVLAIALGGVLLLVSRRAWWASALAIGIVALGIAHGIVVWHWFDDACGDVGEPCGNRDIVFGIGAVLSILAVILAAVLIVRALGWGRGSGSRAHDEGRVPERRA
jgi:hypothetical protein